MAEGGQEAIPVQELEGKGADATVASLDDRDGIDLFSDFILICGEKIKEADKAKKNREDKLIKIVEDIAAFESDPASYVNSKAFKQSVLTTIEIINQEKASQDRILQAYNDLVQELKYDLERKQARHERDEKERKLMSKMTEPEKKNYLKKLKQGREQNAQQKIKLNKELMKTSRQLDRLRKKELTVDEMDKQDSTYLKIAQLEKKCIRLAKEIRKLEGIKLKTGRQLGRQFTYDGSSYPEINQAISKEVTKFLTKEISKGKDVQPLFSSPSYTDIEKYIESTAIGKDLKMIKPNDFKKLAEKIHKDVVGKISKRRKAESDDILQGYSSDEDMCQFAIDDLESEELSKKLKENDKSRKDPLAALAEIKEANVSVDENASTDGDDVQDEEEEEYVEDMEELDEDPVVSEPSESGDQPEPEDDEPQPSTSTVREEFDAAPDRKHRYGIGAEPTLSPGSDAENMKPAKRSLESEEEGEGEFSPKRSKVEEDSSHEESEEDNSKAERNNEATEDPASENEDSEDDIICLD